MGSCGFQCNVPLQWIERQVSPVSVYCVLEYSVMLSIRVMVFQCGSTFVKLPLLPAGTVAI